MIKLISLFLFAFSNAAKRKSKIIYETHIMFLLDSIILNPTYNLKNVFTYIIYFTVNILIIYVMII